ncbi:MAG TPA: cytochrome c oxidase subunit II [Paucimonas sp.]|nr:cytochrome c oxidase subunit II [Paucimonas sp.]
MHPRGSDADRIADLGIVMFIGGGAIFLTVIAFALLALFGPERVRRMLRQHAFIVGGGIVFPVAALSVLLVYALLTSAALMRAGNPPALRIDVTGEMWWWRVVYVDDAGRRIMETANEIRIAAGRPVEMRLTTADVIHSFWVPNLAGKTDMIPGHVNRQRLVAHAPGVFRGECAEYCGAQHAKMAFEVVALEPAAFDAWLASQARPAPSPVDALALRGRQAFFTHDCGKCHTIRGTEATGTAGPDLTHVGSRLSLAAGILPNSIGAFGGWIAASQHIKPGNEMPSFDRLSAEDLRALAAYMESLQ